MIFRISCAGLAHHNRGPRCSFIQQDQEILSRLAGLFDAHRESVFSKFVDALVCLRMAVSSMLLFGLLTSQLCLYGPATFRLFVVDLECARSLVANVRYIWLAGRVRWIAFL